MAGWRLPSALVLAATVGACSRGGSGAGVARDAVELPPQPPQPPRPATAPTSPTGPLPGRGPFEAIDAGASGDDDDDDP